MPLGNGTDRRCIQPADALRHTFLALTEHLEVFMGQAQFARRKDLRVAGQYLLDQRGAGPGQSRDEDWPLRLEPKTADSLEERGRESRDRGADQPGVGLRVVTLRASTSLGQAQRVALLQVLCGARIGAQGVVRLDGVRLEFQGPPAADGCLLRFPLLPQGNRQVMVCLEIVRSQLQGAPIAGDRFVQLSLGHQRGCQVIMCFGKVRPQLQGLSVARDCLIRSLQGLIDHAHIAVEDRCAGVQLDRTTNVLHREVEIACLKGDESEQVPSIGMIRLVCQDLPINLLRRTEPAGPMMRYGNL